ncbi:MAG: prenyltransferase [Deltaproteobacteria bacterium]|nr:prenyltransferase [Deltaproteobacteria bacterium]
MTKLSDWFRETRPQYLALPVVLVFLGSAVAATEGPFYLWRAIVALIGLLSVHISVNVLNDYSDYRSGIDFDTIPTPFSGGSGLLVAGIIEPAAARTFGLIFFGIGIVIGAVFVWVTNWWLLPLLLAGAVSVLFYTDYMARLTLGEIFAGLGLGLLPVMGAAFVHSGAYSSSAVAAGIPAGILTFNLLLINEFPDVEPDRKGGRRNLLLVFGVERGGKLYTLLLVIMYIWILVAVALGLMPVPCLLGLLTLPVALKPMKWAWRHVHENEEMLPVLGANVITNLATGSLLGIGFILSMFL